MNNFEMVITIHYTDKFNLQLIRLLGTSYYNNMYRILQHKENQGNQHVLYHVYCFLSIYSISS